LEYPFILPIFSLLLIQLNHMLNYVPSDISITERIGYLLKVKEQQVLIDKWQNLGLLKGVEDKLGLTLLFEELVDILLDKSNHYHPVLENIVFDLIKYLFQNVNVKINIFVELGVLNAYLNKNYIKSEIDDRYFLHFYLQDYYNIK
jgi:hypothetical protein